MISGQRERVRAGGEGRGRERTLLAERFQNVMRHTQVNEFIVINVDGRFGHINGSAGAEATPSQVLGVRQQPWQQAKGVHREHCEENTQEKN